MKKYISNEILCLNETRDADYPALYESWRDDDVILGYNYRQTRTFDEYVEHCRNNTYWNAVIARVSDGVLIGRIGLGAGFADDGPDLSITIFKQYRGQGYGTTAFALAVRYCFEVLKLDKVYAGCYADNAASRKTLETCGFEPHPEGNDMDKHILTGENRMQYDFVIMNPNR